MKNEFLQKLNVYFTKTSKLSFKIGTLAQKDNSLFFEYDKTWLDKEIELSPLSLPLKKDIFKFNHYSFSPIFGLFDDSLPDGWGLILMDRYFRKSGIDPSTISVLDRLSFMGNNTMGALTYLPCSNNYNEKNIFNLQKLAELSKKIYDGEPAVLIPQLLKAGGSPGGARPKILVGYNKMDNHITNWNNELQKNYNHYIIKFFSKNDFPDSGILEYIYSIMARYSGIEMNETKLFNCKNGESYFGTKRFDREKDNTRNHTHSFGNLIESNFRIPSCDYSDLFKITSYLTKDHSELLKVFRLMVFNILVHNRDDHVKNFSFILDDARKTWKLAPAYDLTYANGPGGEHSMTVNGEGKNPSIKDMMDMAKKYDIKKNIAKNIIEEIITVIEKFPKYASENHLTEKTTEFIFKKLKSFRN
ncbi:type II toxin-antitoxin system HipA family toxin [bacterium]|nr:type II toxin-antitoxin system HipA family toxin [bacterium]